MEIIDDFSDEILSIKNILEYVDEYSMYSYYIGKELELGRAYSSPLRKGDDNPSFCLYKCKTGRIHFKDYANINYKGDIFDFVGILMSTTYKPPLQQILKRIDQDFKIGLYTEDNTPNKPLPLKRIDSIKQKESYTIKITSYKPTTKQFTDFWNKYDITQDILDYYNCTQVKIIHYKSKKSGNSFQITPNNLCIAYQIGGKYKLYHPYEVKSKKFRNDFPENWVEGFMQLKYNNDFCIITKAMKEIMFFRQHFDWDTVAGKSETTKIPNHIMKKILNSYKKVYIWLDKDETGIKSQQEYIKLYPGLIPITYDYSIPQKDVTDRYEYLKTIGESNLAIKEINNLIL